MQALVHVPMSVFISVVAHAVHELLTRMPFVSQVQVVVIHRTQTGSPLLSQQRILKSDAIPLRVDMQLAYGSGLIAAGHQALSQ